MNIPRFTRQAWIAIFGNDASSIELFEEKNYPDNINEFFKAMEDAADIDWVDKDFEFTDEAKKIWLKIVAIDDEFIAWCQDSDLELDVRNVPIYVDSLSDDDVARLFIKNGWTVGYEVLPLPVVITTRNRMPRYTNFSITAETAKKLESFLNSQFCNDFVVFPYLLDSDVLLDEEQKILEFGKEFFTSGTRISYGKWLEQDNYEDGCNCFILHIPIVHRYRRESHQYNVAVEWDKPEPPYLMDVYADEIPVGFLGNEDVASCISGELSPDTATLVPGLIEMSLVDEWEASLLASLMP